jgi:hypothetical protein
MSYYAEKLQGLIVLSIALKTRLQSIIEGGRLYLYPMSKELFRSNNLNKFYWGVVLKAFVNNGNFSTPHDAHIFFGDMFLSGGKIFNSSTEQLEWENTCGIQLRTNDKFKYKIVNKILYLTYVRSTKYLSNKEMCDYLKEIENFGIKENVFIEKFNEDKIYG